VNLSLVPRKILGQSLKEKAIVRGLKEDGLFVIAAIVHVVELVWRKLDCAGWHSGCELKRFEKVGYASSSMLDSRNLT
jgi:hypothetical protein